ncbi:MAG: hypothetical protein CSA09_04530 [Candidatus Contendobacter odensis]|uniref:Sucrose phosphatase-like domain-containing protein n=1 Tax=Candidatus Contendibacter odensensis TaxID=1400860 RepID=A0A2G6PE88_9GAMM|nr:MAG: hypothetical protein CSA09_04530 [Candidatus Contendobacter odensis]
MPRIVVFLDLDDTILQTAPKCPPDSPVEPAATNRAGQVLSFMTGSQRRLLAFWQEQAIVIPVTGRTDDALARVLIEFGSWKITHHGAVIRQPDGQLPRWWFAEVRPALIAAQPLLWKLSAQLEAGAAAGGYRVRSHSVGEWLSYISVKTDADSTVLTQLQTHLKASSGLPPELAVHCNGNNLAVVVRGAQKKDAVQRVMTELERDGAIVTMGAGDSLTDLPFMQLCDFALVPKASQIQSETWCGYGL